MTRDRNDLDPEFREKVDELLSRLKGKGHRYKIDCTDRSPDEQAKLWRRHLQTSSINAHVKYLRLSGAMYIAHVIERVGPQKTAKKVTGAYPGNSWHQWGKALDVWVPGNDGKPVWDWKLFVPYREEALKLGLHIGPQSDWPHVQLLAETPLTFYGSLEALDSALQMRWEGRRP